ncbi:hypothetical protein DFH06DRAFT_1142757 [Mycena polygramma]|nr:hypothetical protein DFH06DRAFT_1142757 [Mycena polygramma]
MSSPSKGYSNPNTTPCVSAYCTAAEKPRPSRQKCVQSFCKECCLATSVICRVGEHNKLGPAPSSSSIGPAPAYAHMISPDVAKKIADKAFTLSPSTRMQTEAYQMEIKDMLNVRYWAKNGERPFLFRVPITAYPFFHPKDCPAMTAKLGLSLTSYDILDVVANPLDTTAPEDDEWVTTNLATRVKVDTTLYMRSTDVQVCVGLRPLARKRVVSNASEPPSSSPISPAHTPSPNKRARVEQSTPFVASFEFATFCSFVPASEFNYDLLPPSPSPSRTASSSSQPITRTDAPLGKRTPFPLAYACDMDAIFQRVELLPATWTAKQKFDSAFGHLDVAFNSSTYSSSWNAWRRCPPHVLGKAIACGHKAGGEWGPIICDCRITPGKTSRDFSKTPTLYSFPHPWQKKRCLHMTGCMVSVALLRQNSASVFSTRSVRRKLTSPQDIISAHDPNSDKLRGSRNVDTAIESILDLEIAVDWDFVLAKTVKKPSPLEVNNLFRTFFKEGTIDKPLGIQIPSSSPLSSLANSPTTSTGDLPKPEEAAGPMDIDQGSLPKPEQAAGPMDVDQGSLPKNDEKKGDSDDEWQGIPEGVVVGSGPDFYYALEKCAIDKPWTVALLVKDCTVDAQNPATDFALDVNITLDQYGPDECNKCLFVQSEEVIKELEDTVYCPAGKFPFVRLMDPKLMMTSAAPWDLYWCLPGYPSIVGPVARRHSDEQDIQMDNSHRMFREIPVVGSEDALRSMVVFKHPNDPDCTVPGLEDVLDNSPHINNITPYGVDVKMEEDIKPEVKSKSKRKVSEKTEQLNNEKIKYLVPYLTELHPILKEIRDVKATQNHQFPTPVPQLVSWIDEIAALRKKYQHVPYSGDPPATVRGKKIFAGDWQTIVDRGPTYFKACIDAHTYLETCRNEWDVKQYLADDSARVGVSTLIDVIKNKAWDAQYTRQA